MSDLTKANGSTEITAQDQILNAHQFLKDFLAKFDIAKRGGIHDFMEIALFNMINNAIKDIDFYLSSGHKTVSPQEIMSVFADSCQKVIDGIKRNLETMKQVNFR